MGWKFAALEGVVVVDTDHVITNDQRREWIRFGPKRVRQEWEKCFKANIQQSYSEAVENKAKLLLFVGIVNGGADLDDTVTLESVQIEKYFLDIPSEMLLTRFYTRVGEKMEKAALYNLSTQYNLPTQEKYLDSAENDKRWHLAHGFSLIGPIEMEAMLKRQLNL